MDNTNEAIKKTTDSGVNSEHRFCVKCGNQMEANAKFCTKCGNPVNNENVQNKNELSENIKIAFKNLSLYGKAKVVIFVLMVIVVIAFISEMFGDNKYISLVKGGHPSLYPNISYEDAFESFFSDTSWEYFESANGKDIVEFMGDCIYSGADVTVTMQFTLNYDAGTFEASYLDMNGVPQNDLIMYSLISAVFDDYNN